MIAFSSATSRRNCSTSSLVAPAGAESTPWAWASEPGATKNNTRSAKRVVSERMFFLSQKDLAESKCPAPDTQEHYVKLAIELSTAAVGSAEAQATGPQCGCRRSKKTAEQKYVRSAQKSIPHACAFLTPVKAQEHPRFYRKYKLWKIKVVTPKLYRTALPLPAAASGDGALRLYRRFRAGRHALRKRDGRPRAGDRHLHPPQDEEGEHGRGQVEGDGDAEDARPADLRQREPSAEGGPNLGYHCQDNAVGDQRAGHREQNALGLSTQLQAKRGGSEEEREQH